MAFFEDGDRVNFYRLYDQCIPEQYRVTDLDAQKVEFWLQIYFAMFPALPGSHRDKKGTQEGIENIAPAIERSGGVDLSVGMARLREFIETRGAELAQTPEFLPYYALPFVPQPSKHPTFKQLFLPKWTIDMRGMLERFIANAPSETPPPRIHSILLHYYGLDHEGSAPEKPKRVTSSSGCPPSGTASPSGTAPPGGSSSLPAYQRTAPTPMTSAGFVGPLPTALTAGPRGITPLLEGRIELTAFYPEPDYTDLGAEVLTIDSLVKQVKSLEPLTPSDSPDKDREEGKATASEDEAPADSASVQVSVTEKRECKRAERTARVSTGPPRSTNSSRPTSSGASSESGSVKRPLEAKYLEAPDSVGKIMPNYPEDLSLTKLDYREVTLEFRSGVERLLMSEGDLGPDEQDAESRVSRLVQALRWRITRAPEGSVLRVEAVRTMIRGDVLAIRSKQLSERGPGSLVDAMLLGCRGRVRAELLRLINVLASTGDGRKYLLAPGSRVVAALASTVEPGEADTRARRHLLGALQKLSFHAVAARRMCALGVMGWITKMLLGVVTTGEREMSENLRKSREGMHELSEYDTEHGAALLMNLSLVAQGKRKAAAMTAMTASADDKSDDLDQYSNGSSSILDVMRLLLQSPSESVRVYANGALYSMLREEKFRVACLESGFEELLEGLRQHSDPTFYRQLSHLLGALLVGKGGGSSAESGGPDDDPLVPFTGYPETSSERFEDVAAFDSASAGGVAEEDDVEESASAATTELGAQFAPVGMASGKPSSLLVGEPLLSEEYAAEEGASPTDSNGGSPPGSDEPSLSPFAGGAMSRRFAPVPEDADGEQQGKEPEEQAVEPKQLYRDPDVDEKVTEEEEEGSDTNAGLENSEIDAARFSGALPGDAEAWDDVQDDVEIDAERFAGEKDIDPEFDPMTTRVNITTNDPDPDADPEKSEEVLGTSDKFGVDTMERSGGFGAETVGPDEMTSGEADDEAPVVSSGDVDDEAPEMTSGEVDESMTSQVDEPMTSGDIDDEAPVVSSGEIDEEAPVVSSGDVDEAPVVSSGDVDDETQAASSGEIDDDAPAVSSSMSDIISDEVPVALSSEIEDHVVAAAASSEIEDQAESDGFDEFDDGEDLPVTAPAEPEPVDPLLTPDAEAAGEQSPRL